MKLKFEFADLGLQGPFTLGTVQLGLPYGLGAARPLIDADEASAVLDTASAAGIRWLDTAAAYGHSESRIGAWHSRASESFRLVSKLALAANSTDGECVKVVASLIDQSLSHLGCKRIDIYLAHRATDLLRPPVAAAFRYAKDSGKIGRFGVSVYSTDDARLALQVPGIGAMQIPVSAVAQDFIHSGIIEQAAERDVAVFARSVFLQGALLLDPDRLPAHLAQLAPVNLRLRAIARETGLSLPGLLVGAVNSIPAIYSPVLGVDDALQLSELLKATRHAPLEPELVTTVFTAGRGLPSKVVDPRRWPLSR